MALFVVSFSGLSAAGAVSIADLEVGDRILDVMVTAGGTVGTSESGSFAPFVVTNGELLQIPGSLDSLTLSALVERHVTI